MKNQKPSNSEKNESKRMKNKDQYNKGPIAGGTAAKVKADEFALSMKRVLNDLADEGIKSRTAMAKALTERGYPTARKGQWTAGRVTDMIGRLAAIKVGA